MIRRLGSTPATAILALAGFVALGAAGYNAVTGNLCSLVSGCCDKAACTTSEAKTIAASTESETKACCALGSLAKSASVETEKDCSAKASCSDASSCDKADSKIVAAAFGADSKEGCCKSKGAAVQAASVESNCSKSCGDKTAKTVAASSESASGCCKSKGAAVAAASTETKSGCCATKAKACGLKGIMVHGSRTPVVIPAAFVTNRPATELKSNNCESKAEGACPNTPVFMTRDGRVSQTKPAAYNPAPIQTERTRCGVVASTGCSGSQTAGVAIIAASNEAANCAELCGNGKVASECCNSVGKCKGNPEVDCNTPKVATNSN